MRRKVPTKRMYEKKKKAMGKWGISVLVGPNMGRTMVVAQESPVQIWNI